MNKVVMHVTLEKMYIIELREKGASWFIKDYSGGNLLFTGSRDRARLFTEQEAKDMLAVGGCDPSKVKTLYC